jgi:hypothetical protein
MFSALFERREMQKCWHATTIRRRPDLPQQVFSLIAARCLIVDIVNFTALGWSAPFRLPFTFSTTSSDDEST